METKIVESKSYKNTILVPIIFLICAIIIGILVANSLVISKRIGFWNQPSESDYYGDPSEHWSREYGDNVLEFIFNYGEPTIDDYYPGLYIGLGFLSFIVIAGLGILLFLMMCSKITVTDKRVYGLSAFGRRVDLPLDSVSAVGTSLFNGIAIGSSSGKISFTFIQNSQEIHEEIRKLLLKRQKETPKETIVSMPISNADELKKYKELLDEGIITQEEFDAKKKQLLGL